MAETDRPEDPGRVLVAGATGYLGRNLVEQLTRDGYRVRVLVRRSEQAGDFDATDDVFVGEVTRPETLRGVTDGIDTVFSALGITRQRDGVGYNDVDYGGNLALLRESERAGVRRFVYVSVLHGRMLRSTVRLAAAKERFVDVLTASAIRSVVIRPTGYFSDMTAFVDMARKGTAYLIGSGRLRMNPISGSDLARACIVAAQSQAGDVEVGGPDVLTHEEIARAAFDALGVRPRIRRVPLWLARAAGWSLSHLTPERVYGPLQFFLAVMTADMVAPSTGKNRLVDYFAGEATGKSA